MLQRNTLGRALMACALAAFVPSCAGHDWDPAYETGIKLGYIIKSKSTATKYKWVEGEAPVEQKGTMLFGRDLVSTGTSTESETVTLKRTWHIIGESFAHMGEDVEDDSEHRPIYWVEGRDVITSTGTGVETEINVAQDGNSTVENRMEYDASRNGLSNGYQFILWGDHGALLGSDGFVMSQVVDGPAPFDLDTNPTVFGKIDPDAGQIWLQSNGIHRVMDDGDARQGDDEVSATMIEIRQVNGANLANSDVGSLCLGEERIHQTTTVPGRDPETEEDSGVRLVLDPNCAAGYVSERVGVEWWRGNLPVKFKGTDSKIAIDDYGYEWIVCTGGDNRPTRRQTSKTHPGEVKCGDEAVTVRKYVEYTLTVESEKTMELDKYEEDVLLPNE